MKYSELNCLQRVAMANEGTRKVALSFDACFLRKRIGSIARLLQARLITQANLRKVEIDF